MPTAGEDTDIGHLVRSLLHRGETEIYRTFCLAVDWLVLDKVLQHTDGKQVQAGEILGISRTTLRAPLRGLNLAMEKRLSLESEWHDCTTRMENGR